MPDPLDGAGTTRRYQLRPRRRLARRRLVQFVLTLALLCGLHRWWGDRAEARFEREVAALAAAGEPVSLEALAQSLLPDAVNGTLDLRLASSAAARDGGVDTVHTPHLLNPLALPLTADERHRFAELIEAHRDVFVAIHAGRAKGGVDWQIPVRSPEWMDQAYRLDGMGDVLALLGYAALYERDRGNDAQALEHGRSLLFIGRTLTARPFLFSQRSGNQVASMAARRLAEVAPELQLTWVGESNPGSGKATAEQVRETIREFLDDGPWRDGMRRGFCAERARMAQSCRALADGRAMLSDVYPGSIRAAHDDPVTRLSRPIVHAGFRHAGRPSIYNDGVLLVRHLSAVMRAFEGSPDMPTAWRRIPDRPPGTGGPWGGITHATVAALQHSHYGDTRGFFEAAAERRLAAAVLAARWYASDHGGALPARLEDLVPVYLPAVPLDPLAEGGAPIGYVADPDRPAVYSVGENGKDDGGREYREEDPLPERRQTDEVRHLKRRPRRVLEWRVVEPPARSRNTAEHPGAIAG